MPKRINADLALYLHLLPMLKSSTSDAEDRLSDAEKCVALASAEKKIEIRILNLDPTVDETLEQLYELTRPFPLVAECSDALIIRPARLICYGASHASGAMPASHYASLEFANWP